MSNKMLIDASHPEETRVVVVQGNKIEELDFESEHKKQLKGNIYLARITRVEPSLQAAFVEYGGNRHGFLAFSEIHPDYYQIPITDRLALIEREEKAASHEDDLYGLDEEKNQHKKKSKKRNEASVAVNVESSTASKMVIADDVEDSFDTQTADDDIEVVNAEDSFEEIFSYQRKQERQYKIQEVIKRRQILLVQVIKEERGNKGAALTTYLSLAGRYSVLMPNTARGGGISRKITNVQDRERLKEIVKGLAVPKGMGVILRTAGANRTKAEIKRDYEYLMRLWETVRTLTLKSTAPCLVHEESNLIKRSIRDLYNKNIDEILVSGEQGYREAKDFMRMLMPSHAKVVQPYNDPVPIFTRNDIETQLDKMLHPHVSLKSGGYLVINQTEALVSIDINSGRSTKEHSVEKTALQTNLEAAEEIARQLRLRDLAGLIVIDFIDMVENRNIRLVEKKLKDCLKNDRARIQVGRISHFGLMEMSRQRIRISVLESTMQPCPHCSGTGNIRSASSIALHVMRSIEEYLLHNSQHSIIVRTPVTTALYVLNHKRHVLVDLEKRFNLSINIEADDTIGTQHLVISKGTPIKDDIFAVISENNDTAKIKVVPNVEKEVAVDEPSVKNNQQRRRKNYQNEVHEEETQNDEESHRRGRRGNRRNQKNGFRSPRIPYAEAVGDFAKQALAEIKATMRRRRYVPNAEPVGFSENANDKEQNISSKTNGHKSKKREVFPEKTPAQISEADEQPITKEESPKNKLIASFARKFKKRKTNESVHKQS
ncbi:Ribonuclease E [Bartonella ancashensis]|uniref:Ribonuclease E n=1 Tax=Bartonella ancashensis TaxID=1318743 RepID=A0A0M5KUN3_9HYPH|nr:ribonuclease E/G [Bartonella ancashensis]ALE03798.1 Ribonuclease E [Bartonella ancashensis]